MHEIELKLQVPPARRDAVRREVAGRSGAVQRLQAAYFDTPRRALAEAGLALRLRREGRRWVQTLKGHGADAMTRLEHEVARGGAAAMPAIDPALHDGTPAGARLSAVLAEVSEEGAAAQLACVYRTDIRRTSRRARAQAGQVELAFDEGRIAAGAESLPVCELEIESLAGAPAAVLDVARRWIERHHLWIDVRSKAERGDLLARGLAIAPERKAQPVALDEHATLVQARRAVLASCLDQIVVNASTVASGTYADEHVHQLRVGLRRLRSAARLFDGLDPSCVDTAGPIDAATALFRALGAARDRAAVDAPLRAQLQRALVSAGLAVEVPGLPAAAGAVDPADAVRASRTQGLLLDLLAAVQPGDEMPQAGDAASPRALVAARLNHWHKRIAAEADRFAELDDAARHRLRRRVKRLRYAVEFVGTWWGARAVRRYLAPLRKLQERLGALSDVLVALEAHRAANAGDPGSLFALGWLAARREVLIAQTLPALKRFTKAKRFWK